MEGDIMGLFESLISNITNKMSGKSISTIEEYLNDMKLNQGNFEYLYNTYFKQYRAVWLKDKKTLDMFMSYIESQGLFKEWFYNKHISEITYRHDNRYGDECILFMDYSGGNYHIGIFTLATQEKNPISFEQLTKINSYGWLYYPKNETFDKYCLVKYKWNDGSNGEQIGYSIAAFEERKY